MEDRQEEILRLENISFSYPKVQALKSVRLTLEDGGLYGLLGPNGAGKTTLMKVILGFLKPQTGDGRILGYPLRDSILEIRRRIGYMPESDCLIPGMDAVTETAYLGRISGLPPTEAIKRAHEVLYYVGLGEERYRKVDTYSTGMKQKLKLAQALVHDPQLLLLDEPTSGMDPNGRREMLDLIKDIAGKGRISIIVSSHLLPDIEAVCRSVLIMNKGEIVAQEQVQALNQSSANVFEVKFTGDTERFLAELSRLDCRIAEWERGISKLVLPISETPRTLFSLAQRNKVQIRHFKRVQSTLEDAFMKAIGESNGY